MVNETAKGSYSCTRADHDHGRHRYLGHAELRLAHKDRHRWLLALFIWIQFRLLEYSYEKDVSEGYIPDGRSRRKCVEQTP